MRIAKFGIFEMKTAARLSLNKLKSRGLFPAIRISSHEKFHSPSYLGDNILFDLVERGIM